MKTDRPIVVDNLRSYHDHADDDDPCDQDPGDDPTESTPVSRDGGTSQRGRRGGWAAHRVPPRTRHSPRADVSSDASINEGGMKCIVGEMRRLPGVAGRPYEAGR